MSPSKSKMPGLLTKSGAQINAESHRPSLHTSIPRLSYLLAGCIALGVAAVCKPLLFGLGTGVLSIVVCTLPPLAVVAVARPPINPCPPTPTRPPQAPYKSRLTTLGFCFMGIGLYMGVIGFSSDNLEPGTYASLQLMVGTLGALLACTLLALSMRVTPEGPYVLLPVLVGTTSLVFLLTTMAQNPGGPELARIAGAVTDDFAFVLAACTAIEYSKGLRAPYPATGGVLVTCALSLLASILLGGIVMSTVGLNTTSIVLTVVSLVYGALLGLGLSVQQRSRSSYVIVRNLVDMDRIADAQARVIVKELGTLTPREAQVLLYLLQHQSAETIAEKLGISRNTVKSHMAHIYEKAGVNTRQQLVDYAASKTIEL